jgi:hypothetical protein
MSTCVAVDREIPDGTTCPLDKGQCYWQHRQTKVCCYTDAEMTVQEFCAHVGIKGHPSEDQVGRFMVKLRSVL